VKDAAEFRLHEPLGRLHVQSIFAITCLICV
jgi:hypothetical protein